jgi:hypothetical protein
MSEHAKYPKPLSDYAKIYDRSLICIKQWIRRGKQSGRLPPLEDTAAMRDWYAEHIGPPPEDMQPPPAPREARDFSQVKALDIERNVEALRVTLSINKQLLDEALQSADERTVALRQRNYERCFNLLRLAEQSLTELQKQRGQLIDRERVLGDQTKIVETLKQMRERMARDIMIELEKNCSKRLRRVFGHLREMLEPAIERVRMSEELIFSKGLRE